MFSDVAASRKCLTIMPRGITPKVLGKSASPTRAAPHLPGFFTHVPVAWNLKLMKPAAVSLARARTEWVPQALADEGFGMAAMRRHHKALLWETDA